MYIRIAELYLKDGDTTNSETFCTRAALIINPGDDPVLVFRHRICHAHIFNRKMKFLDAALRYLEVSVQIPDNIEYLNQAITCTILAPAGPQRNRLLSQLCKDERIERSTHYPVLLKMYNERFISSEEVAALEHSLLEHQKVQTDHGTVLQKAIREHNVVAASNLYKNMLLDDLGQYLGVDAEKAERTLTTMIAEKRLDALVDQMESAVHFSQPKVDKLNRYIQKVCTHINNAVDEITVINENSMEIVA